MTIPRLNVRLERERRKHFRWLAKRFGMERASTHSEE
jgi:hypothetical protein